MQEEEKEKKSFGQRVTEKQFEMMQGHTYVNFTGTLEKVSSKLLFWKKH